MLRVVRVAFCGLLAQCDGGGGEQVGGGVDLGLGAPAAQKYAIPDGVSLVRYWTVVIWCRRFTYAFGAAALG